MRSIPTRLLSWLLLLALLLTVSACATSSPPPPVVVQPIKLDPLPASVTGIDLKLSDPWRARASEWLRKLDDFSTNATSK